jgi:hypothetical protein
MLLSTECVFWFALQICLHYTIQRDIVINAYSSSCNVDVILVRLQWNLNYPYRYLEKRAHITNYFKICPTGAKFFHVDGHDEAVVTLCNLGNVSQNSVKFNKP